jgi:hypothetical protein
MSLMIRRQLNILLPRLLADLEEARAKISQKEGPKPLEDMRIISALISRGIKLIQTELDNWSKVISTTKSHSRERANEEQLFANYKTNGQCPFEIIFDAVDLQYVLKDKIDLLKASISQPAHSALLLTLPSSGNYSPPAIEEAVGSSAPTFVESVINTPIISNPRNHSDEVQPLLIEPVRPKEFVIHSINCFFCGMEGHRPSLCPTYKSINARKERLRELKRCSACAMEGHQVSECQARSACPHCNGKHHYTICTNRKPFSGFRTGISSDRGSFPNPTPMIISGITSESWRKESIVSPIIFNHLSHHPFGGHLPSSSLNSLEMEKGERIDIPPLIQSPNLATKEISPPISDGKDIDISALIEEAAQEEKPPMATVDTPYLSLPFLDCAPLADDVQASTPKTNSVAFRQQALSSKVHFIWPLLSLLIVGAAVAAQGIDLYAPENGMKIIASPPELARWGFGNWIGFAGLAFGVFFGMTANIMLSPFLLCPYRPYKRKVLARRFRMRCSRFRRR